MPRNVWAKVYCDLLELRLLRKRPDCDVRLVLGLILHAKKHAPDGVLWGLDAEESRGLFGIKAPLRQVQDGWDYLLAEGWLAYDTATNTFRIRDFAQRQAKAGDTPEAMAIRQQRYYANHKPEVLARKKSSRLVLRESSREERSNPHGFSTSVLTRPHAPFPHADGDEERKSDRSADSAQGYSQSVDNSALAALSESDRAQVQALLGQGRVSEATALLASLQPLDLIKKTSRSGS